MRESRTYGSVRGALSNERPYRVVEGARQSWRDPAGSNPAEVGPSEPPGSECCVRRRRRRTRSVHSGCVGCVIEPRNDETAGAEAVTYGRTQHVQCRRAATGDMIIVRYADDFIVGFQHERDARRFLDEMRERLQKFALTLHPEKTRLIEFGRFAAERRQRRGLGKPETFNFLGFTFICGKTREGKFQIKRKTRADRMRAKLKMVQEEMWRRMHQPIAAQGKWLWYVVNGYFNYHAVPTNSKALVAFRTEIAGRWRRVLIRRSERTRLNWKQMQRLVDDWLPKPRVLHPWPNKRFAVRYLR